jgi:uncharacterized protein
MTNTPFRGPLANLTVQYYNKVFVQPWTLLQSAVLVGILSIITFAWDRPWGVVGGLRNWGDWLFHLIGLYPQTPASPVTFSSSVLTFGLIWGAFIAALMSRQFGLRVPPRLELYKGLAGGLFLGVGSAFAGGCNVGGFYTAFSAMSLSALSMMIGLILGAYVGLKYLYWEMEHFESAMSGGEKPASGFDFKRIQPVLGAVLILTTFVISELYSREGFIILGGLLLCGTGFGFIMHRGRLCFARCFREPFMTGDGEMTRAVILSILISLLGFATLKWVGLRGEMVFVAPNFGLGGLLGGLIFGFGMIIAGGCGSGTVWRAAEGQVKLILALLMFILSNSVTRFLTDASPAMQSFIGFQVYLPDYIGYQGTLIVITALMLLWYLLVTWNEETDHFVVEP